MKKEISRQVKVRHIPELIFKIDHSMDYGRHIEEILDTIDFDSYQKDEEEAEDADGKRRILRFAFGIMQKQRRK